ncbi:MAG: helix-turn-helix transcriptional regulator [Roseburia sp.]|nr:helix-turn-helix transcriptional regulator [Roseburia sp.]
MKFNENLVKYRKIKGLTQEDMAEKMQVSRQSVSKWENGEAVPELAKIIKLADILDVSLDVLCGREEKEHNSPESTYESKNTKKKCKNPFLIIILTVTIVASGMFGYCVGIFGKDEPYVTSELYELPDVIEVTGVTFRLDKNVLTCEFVPSVYSEKLSYHVNVSDYWGKKTSYEPEFKNGIGEAAMIVGTHESYKVVLEITNGEESRSITLVEEIFIENNGFSYYE